MRILFGSFVFACAVVLAHGRTDAHENKIRAEDARIGPLKLDAKWNGFRPYVQRITEVVYIAWERLMTRCPTYPEVGTQVSVKFTLNRKGEVARIVLAKSDAGREAEHACVSAITQCAPYGDWTDDMVAVLGDEQEMTFTFYYQ